MADFLQFKMRKTGLLSVQLQKLPVESGKEPGLYFRSVLQLMAFVRPDIERLLRQVAGVAFFAGQAQGKSVECGIIELHQTFEVQLIRHTAFIWMGVTNSQIVPGIAQTRPHPFDDALSAPPSPAGNLEFPGTNCAFIPLMTVN